MISVKSCTILVPSLVLKEKASITPIALSVSTKTEGLHMYLTNSQMHQKLCTEMNLE